MPIQEVIHHSGSKAPVKVWTDDIEASAREQLSNLSTVPFIHKHVAVMPDVHWGMGSTIGSVIPTKGAIIPAAVGVDLGCGMMACKIDLHAEDLPDNLGRLRGVIESLVPHGRTANGGRGDRGAWSDIPDDVNFGWLKLVESTDYAYLKEKHEKIFTKVNDINHLGTLGTGNHFIEVCLDEHDDVWVMLHSGSRGIGNRIGSSFIQKAKEEMKRWHINLPDVNLAYLPEGSDHFTDYVKAVNWAQNYALMNREIMMNRVLNAIEHMFKRPVTEVEKAVNCHHNYIAKENHYGANVWVTRKGAVRAREGDLGIIPGSMGARSYIVEGLGNKEAFNSCSHGAGRTMSRTAAKKLFSEADLARQTEGVECRKDADVIDEIPGAYKDIDAVMEFQSDLVRPLYMLKQILCVKG